MEHLKVENLRKVFRVQQREEIAVSDVSLSIKAGEFVSLLGPSGCGKTTTLRCIAGLERQSSGMISIAGRDCSDASPQQRNIGMCFQEATVYPHMTIRRNMEYPLKLSGVAVAERRQRAEEMARMLRLDHLIDKLPGQLSGGQRQRAALGRALIRKPSLFLLDEPMSSLDAKLKVEMRKEIKGITTLFGTTALYVTHDQEEAMAMSDRICVMSAGRIEQFDTPEAVYRTPASLFVATFIGMPAMNVVEVDVGDGQLRARTEAGLLPVLDLPTAWQGLATPVTHLGVRPEDVRLGAQVDPAGGLSFQGKVNHVEILGERTILHMDCALGEIRATLYGIARYRMGDPVSFQIPVDKVHLFDKAGLRVECAA